MNETIRRKLSSIEQKENIRILLAVESGSRAWGFASPDSDYDVRFLYVRPKEFYLRLDQTRDVIEQPINDLLDISGWDLSKSLRLLHGSNPTLYEWFASPIVYRTPAFHRDISPLLGQCFSPKRNLHHYLNTAVNHEKAFLRGSHVRIKKYFYVLRPLLACRWVLDQKTPPPVPFSQLIESQLACEMRPYVDELLALKMNAPELKEIQRIGPLHEYIGEQFDFIRAALAGMPDDAPAGWSELNRFFLSELDYQP